MARYRASIETPWTAEEVFAYLSVCDADLRLKGALRLGDPLLGLAFNRVGDRALAGLRAVLTTPARGAIGAAA
jgi:hypothetical protein